MACWIEKKGSYTTIFDSIGSWAATRFFYLTVTSHLDSSANIDGERIKKHLTSVAPLLPDDISADKSGFVEICYYAFFAQKPVFQATCERGCESATSGQFEHTFGLSSQSETLATSHGRMTDDIFLSTHGELNPEGGSNDSCPHVGSRHSHGRSRVCEPRLFKTQYHGTVGTDAHPPCLSTSQFFTPPLD